MTFATNRLLVFGNFIFHSLRWEASGTALRLVDWLEMAVVTLSDPEHGISMPVVPKTCRDGH
jgi:hypothetical protein